LFYPALTLGQMIFFTSILSNYMARALLLAESTLKNHPGWRFKIFIYDYDAIPSSCLDGLRSSLSGVELSSLEFCDAKNCLPSTVSFVSRFDVIEACTAVKPFIARTLLESHEFVVYLDPDIYVYSPIFLGEDAVLSQTWDVQLTPHVLGCSSIAPLSERLFLFYGTFNLGYFAFRRTSESLRFVDWWCDMVDSYGQNLPVSGLFVDQKFLDLAPSFVERLNVSRHPGWNVAWWNLFSDERRLRNGNRISYADEIVPLVFFHFSNLDTEVVDPFVSRPLRSLQMVERRSLLLKSNPEIHLLYQDYTSHLTAYQALVSQFMSDIVPVELDRSVSAKFGRLVNSELHRMVYKHFEGETATLVVKELQARSIVVRLVYLSRMQRQSGLRFIGHMKLCFRIFVKVLFSPSLFDYSRPNFRRRA
jgi:hypothetical protein